MDCKTARLVLEFLRPGAGEADAAERAAFEQHLAGCPECDALARAERGLEHAFAKAMRAVDVPSGLRNRVLDRLERERGESSLRRFGRAGRLAAAAAAVLLAGWGVYAWRQSHLPPVNMNDAWDDLVAARAAPPSRDDLADRFRKAGFEGALPDLNYSLLSYYGMGEFQGRQVPQLIFLSPQGDARARVRVLSAKQFNLTNPPTGFQSPPGYGYKLALWNDPAAGCAVLVDYTGGATAWLRPEPADGERAE
jgi:hypothetical protein